MCKGTKMWTVFRRFRSDKCSRTKQRLSAYIDLCLSPQELSEVESHLAACRACQKELESLQATAAMLGQLPQVSPPRSFRIAQKEPSGRWAALPVLRLATAAAAVLLVMAFTADIVNLFETGPSPLGQENDNSSYSVSPENSRDSTSLGGENETEQWQIYSDNEEELGLGSEEELKATEAAWIHPLEYSLAGLVIVLGGVSSALWLKSKGRRQKGKA
jgi:hypothetical protein